MKKSPVLWVGILLVLIGGVLITLFFFNPTAETPNPTSSPPVRVTTAYMHLTNTGGEADTLISATSPATDRVIIAVNQIILPPNEAVILSPETQYLSLFGLKDALYRGDSIPLTLTFESGLEISITLVALDIGPTEDITLQRFTTDTLMIEDAWVVATEHSVRQGAEDSVTTETAYTWQLPKGFPAPLVPDDNPMSAEKVELGRYLFYDTRLSGNETLSCESCHAQALAFSDGLAVPIGSTGQAHPRNSQTLTNIAYNPTYTWANPILTEVEQQILIPLFGEFPVEMGVTGNEAAILGRLQSDTDYPLMFQAAFPEDAAPINFHNVVAALSSFVRTLISGNSPYDRYVYQGDRTTLSESALRGMNLFLGEKFECHHCHGGFNFTASTIHANSTFIERPFFNTGLFNINGEGAYPPDNQGIYEITGNPDDMGRFRPPSLRNIELTAPYMHDGSIATLEEVIQFYADGGRVIREGDYAGNGRDNPYKSTFVPGFEITEQEATDIINFLKSLTDETFITDPRFSNPFEP